MFWIIANGPDLVEAEPIRPRFVFTGFARWFRQTPGAESDAMLPGDALRQLRGDREKAELQIQKWRSIPRPF
jgi:hypothetical protein